MQAAQQVLSDPKVQAIMQIVQMAEGGDFYTVYGGKTISSLSTYPSNTNAAGAFQVTPGTYSVEKNRLGISDFSVSTQKLIFADLAIQNGAVSDLQAGNLAAAITDLSKTWAAIPTGPDSADHSRYKYTLTSGTHKAGDYQPSIPYDTIQPQYSALTGQ